MAALVMTAAAVAEALAWMTRGDDPQPRTEKVRRMVREGRFPQPIDPAEPVHLWRWSRADVERYAAGRWPRPPANAVVGPGETVRPFDRGAA